VCCARNSSDALAFAFDAPVEVHGWQPENYGRHYRGEVTLAEAFADSLNDATIRLSREVGIGAVIAAARDLGLRAPLESNPSFALSTSEVSTTSV
jgi:membrane peptidoglycan carboxypeptidase